MAISVEYGMQKFAFFIFSVLLLALALYPTMVTRIPTIEFFDQSLTYYVIAALALIQLIFTLRIKRPRIF